jgi:hypothetical protein
MEMFLMAACMSLFGLAITALAFRAASGPDQPEPEVHTQPEPLKPFVPARFFADTGGVMPAQAHMRVPIEALLLQIENHVRLEQAAAESFLESPTSALLHSKTISRLVQ